MATWRQALEVVITEEEIGRLTAITRSRTEPASRVQRAQMLLAYRENPSFFAVGQRVGVHHQTVQRCIERALAYGPLMALDDRPRLRFWKFHRLEGLKSLARKVVCGFPQIGESLLFFLRARSSSCCGTLRQACGQPPRLHPSGRATSTGLGRLCAARQSR
jgi:hypothetical protein